MGYFAFGGVFCGFVRDLRETRDRNKKNPAGKRRKTLPGLEPLVGRFLGTIRRAYRIPCSFSIATYDI